VLFESAFKNIAMLALEILTSDVEMEAIADQWRALHARANGSFITDYDAFTIWWRCMGRLEPRSLHVVVGRENGALAAVLPLTVVRRKGMRILQSDAGLLPECDVLSVNPAHAAELWNAARQSPHYDFAKIKAVYDGTPCNKALAAFASEREEVESFYLRFDWKTSAEWLASLSSKVRNDFKRNMRRLEEKGPVKYEVCTKSPLPRATIERMIRQKRDWCKAHDTDGPFSHPNISDYFMQLMEKAAETGHLFFAWLTCGEDEVAYDLRFMYDGVVNGYVLAYDAAYAKFSPGNVMISNSVAWAIDNGLKGLDFKYTSESASQKFFKLKFCNDVRKAFEYTFSNSLKGRVIENAFVTLRGWGRAARQRMQPKLKEKSNDNAEGQKHAGEA
jgi:CelD/BcsL family acetyltransferase involved in cellulose biosynthesis